MKKLIAAMLALIMTLALVPTMAFAEETLNTTNEEDTAVLASANARGIFTRDIRIDAYEGKGFDFIKENKLGVAFEYKGSQVGSGKSKIYILQDGKLTGKASGNTAHDDPGIIIKKDGIAYKFSHAGVLGNYNGLKEVYYHSSKKQWYYSYSSVRDIPVSDRGQINFVYDKTGDNTYILNYDANGGTGAPASDRQVKKSLATATFTISQVAPTREGYKFLGWTDSSNGTVKYKAGDGLTLTYTSDVTEKTIYAVWEAKENITLTYDANGGAGAPASETKQVEKGQSAAFTVSATEPAKENYTFKGWSTNKDAMTADAAYAGGNSITISQNTTLYAVWEENNTPIEPPTDTPNLPADIIKELVGSGNIQVQCTTANTTHPIESYSLLDESYTTGTVTKDGDAYTCTITVDPAKYVAEYNKTHGSHTLNPNSQSGSITFKWENDEWTLLAGQNLPITFTVVHDTQEPPTPSPSTDPSASPTPTPGGGNGSGHSHYYPTTTPVPVIVIPPKTGDMTIWQSILRFLGIR